MNVIKANLVNQQRSLYYILFLVLVSLCNHLPGVCGMISKLPRSLVIIITLFKSHWINPRIVALPIEETINQTESQKIDQLKFSVGFW